MAAAQGSVNEHDLREAVAVIPDRLYWVALPATPPRNTATAHFFSIDQEFVYEAFFADFGPLKMSFFHRYCRMLEAKMTDPMLADKRIVHYCSQDPKRRANAACLICAFLVVSKGLTAEKAFEPFHNIYPPFLPFRDATQGVCTYQMTVLDTLRGLQKGMELGWYSPDKFDCELYDFFDQVDNGDMSWIIPDKFLAFAGPFATSVDAEGWPCFTPEDYVPMFKEAGIGLVVRLNKKQYDRRRFIDHGIKHVDLYFLDGSCPSK